MLSPRCSLQTRLYPWPTRPDFVTLRRLTSFIQDLVHSSSVSKPVAFILAKRLTILTAACSIHSTTSMALSASLILRIQAFNIHLRCMNVYLCVIIGSYIFLEPHANLQNSMLLIYAGAAPLLLMPLVNIVTIRSWWDLHSGWLGRALWLSSGRLLWTDALQCYCLCPSPVPYRKSPKSWWADRDQT